jgi:hypothetical protein
MKESKFIELLNLYVDHEISAEEACLLEQEIAANPERRRVYQQYCRMHRATVLLGSAFSAEAPVPGVPVAREERKAWLFWCGTASLVGAAAVLAFVVMTPSREASFNQPLAKLEPQQTPIPPVSDSGLQELTRNPDTKPIQAPQSYALGGRRNRSLPAGELAKVSLDWVNNVELPEASELVLNSQELVVRPLPAKSAVATPLPAKPQQRSDRSEMTAFQFQK